MHRFVRRRALLVIFLGATVLGVFSAIQAYNYVALFSERPQPLAILLGLNMSYWYAWALLAPLVLWLARTYRFERGKWVRALAVHVPAVIVITFAHAMLLGAGRVATMLFLAEREVDWWLGVRERFFLYFDWEMMTYWAIIAASHAYDFYRESQERALTTAQLQTRLAEAQLQALQRQLHPHFLFNTLHTISALMHRDIDAADSMLGRLSDLLRLTLERVGTQMVPLKDELDFIHKYLDIERTRYGERLHVTFVIEPDTLSASVPNFVLQPIVENALRHGIGPKVGGGRVEVRAHHNGEWLQLVVQDDGYGVPADRLDAFNTGVGLTNTRSRLEHLYPGNHTFEFQTPAGGGLAVTIVIPFAVDAELMEESRSVA
ncbi:MAG TPA: histidine kinase [Vicinamibacterales bacterium]|jgi:signal transduction histidine kinase|nr:histidine kinase [Vicinamibacterales bacterium]